MTVASTSPRALIRQDAFDGMSYDAEAWPLVIFEMRSREVTADHAAFMRRVWGSVFEQRTPFYALSDIWLTTQPDALSRKRIVDMELELHDRTVRYQKGSVVILRSPVIRTLYRGILWFRPRPFPQVVAADRAEAARIARNEMVELGLPVSAAVDAKLRDFVLAGYTMRPPP